MKKKIISLCIALLMLTVFLPLGAFAADETIVNVTAVRGTVVASSTLYAGEVFLDGESVLQYVYSDDITRSTTVVAAARDGFGGPDDDGFPALFPQVIGEEGTGLAGCSNADYTAYMDENWKDAAYVAENYYPDKTVESSESVDLFQSDEEFADRCRVWWEDVELLDQAGGEYEMVGPLGALSSTNTDSVTYTVIDGKLVKIIDREEDHSLESITVIYTSVHLKTKAAGITRIENVDLGITPPAAGTNSSDVSAADAVALPENADYTLSGASWEIYDGDGFVECEGAVFEAGETYYLRITLEAKENCAFSQGGPYPYTSATVTGDGAALYNNHVAVTNIMDSGGGLHSYCEIMASFTPADPSTIYSLTVNVTPPKAGQRSIETDPVVTVKGTDCEVDSATWLMYLSGYTTEEMDVTFEEGETYYVYVLIKARDGKIFNKGAYLSGGVDEGFYIFDGCTVKGGELKFAASRTFGSEDYLRLKIAVTAAAAGGLPCTGGDDCPGKVFTDMPKKSNWAHDAIDWAVYTGVTSGMTKTTFGPSLTITRGQVVTFLWRAAGSPEPTTEKTDFTDVKKTGFYYKAVLWAVENGITNGVTKTSFDPGGNCTRGQIVAFLYRYAGSPAVDKTNSKFTDVKKGAFYEAAVAWAVAADVTAGTSATTFSPNSVCTRAQTVTFLYRLAESMD